MNNTTIIIRTKDQLESKLEELEGFVKDGKMTKEEAHELEVEFRCNYIKNGVAYRD